VEIHSSTESLGPHAVRVEVTFTDGRQPEYLRRTLYLLHGKDTFGFVPALNVPVGEWRAHVVDCISGVEASDELEVR